jgi:hypothetical protein
VRAGAEEGAQRPIVWPEMIPGFQTRVLLGILSRRVRQRMARVPDAVQHERSEVMHRRAGTPVILQRNRGPGSAAHRYRAALRPGHEFENSESFLAHLLMMRRMRASHHSPPSSPGNRVRAEARPGRKLDPAIHEAVRPPRAYVRHCNLAMLHGSPGHGASRRPGDDAECGSSPGMTLSEWRRIILMVRSAPMSGLPDIGELCASRPRPTCVARLEP